MENVFEKAKRADLQNVIQFPAEMRKERCKEVHVSRVRETRQ